MLRRGINRLGATELADLTIKSRGNSHFHATDEAAVHSYNAMACDLKG
jgi:hypothetical protein